MTPKNSTSESYDKIAQWYDVHRSREFFEKLWLDQTISYLKPNAKILDLGCGMDEPIAQYFIEAGFSLVGIDS